MPGEPQPTSPERESEPAGVLITQRHAVLPLQSPKHRNKVKVTGGGSLHKGWGCPAHISGELPHQHPSGTGTWAISEPLPSHDLGGKLKQTRGAGGGRDATFKEVPRCLLGRLHLWNKSQF